MCPFPSADTGSHRPDVLSYPVTISYPVVLPSLGRISLALRTGISPTFLTCSRPSPVWLQCSPPFSALQRRHTLSKWAPLVPWSRPTCSGSQPARTLSSVPSFRQPLTHLAIITTRCLPTLRTTNSFSLHLLVPKSLTFVCCLFCLLFVCCLCVVCLLSSLSSSLLLLRPNAGSRALNRPRVSPLSDLS